MGTTAQYQAGGIVASQLSGNAGLIGAAFLAIKKQLYE